MAKADRLARVDEQRIALEGEYRVALIAALRITAAGQWGLFEHNQDRVTMAKAAPLVEELEEIAAAIERMRGQLGIERFELHREFLASRGKVSPSAVGEPKQAQAWLAKLEAE
jgi:hypothetical protein